MKEKLMFNRKYDKDETPRDKLNRYRSRNRKLEKENKRLRSELNILEQNLRSTLARVEELTRDIKLEVLIGAQEETQEIEDVPSTEA